MLDHIDHSHDPNILMQTHHAHADPIISLPSSARSHSSVLKSELDLRLRFLWVDEVVGRGVPFGAVGFLPNLPPGSEGRRVNSLATQFEGPTESIVQPYNRANVQ